MNAKKCDRCGRLFEDNYNFDFSNLRNFVFYTIEKQAIPDIYSRKLDLCQKCEADLRNFMDIAKEEDEHDKR